MKKKPKIDPIVGTDPFLGVSTTKSGKNVDKRGGKDPKVSVAEVLDAALGYPVAGMPISETNIGRALLHKDLGGFRDSLAPPRGGEGMTNAGAIDYIPGRGLVPRVTSATRLSKDAPEFTAHHGFTKGVTDRFTLDKSSPHGMLGRGTPYTALEQRLSESYSDHPTVKVGVKMKNPLDITRQPQDPVIMELAEAYAKKDGYKKGYTKGSPEYIRIRDHVFHQLRRVSSTDSDGHYYSYDFYKAMRNLAQSFLPDKMKQSYGSEASWGEIEKAISAQERQVRLWIRHAGFDGIIGRHENSVDTGDMALRPKLTQAVAFSPTQTRIIAQNAPRIAHETYGGHH